ncbi:MAG: hypothetical protein N2317_00845 [Syntrophales bacterium]|nr:hypothetical protein [Syntrophales bacterium]
MESLWFGFTTHQIAVIAVLGVALLVIYFLVKSLFRLAFFLILILVCVGGYFYITAPKKSPADVMKVWESTRKQASDLVEVGKKAVDTGKVMIEKGKKVAENLEKIAK